jgi:hypothetical protein
MLYRQYPDVNRKARPSIPLDESYRYYNGGACGLSGNPW